MIVLGLDVETTGLSSEKDDIIEIGAVLWDTDRGIPLLIKNYGVRTTNPISSFITDLTGITQEDNALYNTEDSVIALELELFIKHADYLVAHNHQFDKRFLTAWIKKQGSLYDQSMFDSKPWIDTQTDLPTEAYGKSKALPYLAADNGFVNPFAHRAVFDVLTMLTVLQKHIHNLDLAKEKVYLEAVVSIEEKDKAKKEGFRWNPDRKVWWKIDVKKKQYSYDFKVIEKPVGEVIV